MSRRTTPKFMKPGDDPELDRLIEKARSEGSEPPGEYYYDLFGRRRRLAVVPAEVDQDAPTSPGGSWASKGAEIDKASLPSALVPSPPAASTGPVVTEMPAGVPAKMTQARVLRLAMMAISGPVLVMAIGAVWMNTRVPRGQPAGTLGSAITPPLAPFTAPLLPTSGAAPPGSAVGPAVEQDAGAPPALTSPPNGVRPGPVKPRGKVVPRPSSTDDPYADPAAPVRKPDTGSKIW